ncbi:MAG TPA: SpoIID/LytB domain-containing protein [Acidobacteriota bacterium]|nr:SpoIID/LytB domain-containing protein [Acidobacteriota bacterium]HQF85922.1 SpoIID/LytB domain-containing protein [Acidobacteriota bacterium]HQG90834.1 SpoIID/LytB domain-containing protein [Acidobacteriota bacterium]HQK87554.1 SpoIID/LytB domain-containing protein [Acidobacteriota bacterium]
MNRRALVASRAVILMMLLSAALSRGEAAAPTPVVRIDVLGLFRPPAVELVAVDTASFSFNDGGGTVRVLPPGAAVALSRNGGRVQAVHVGQIREDGRQCAVTPAAPDGRIEIRLANGFRRVFCGTVTVRPAIAGDWLQLVAHRPLEDYVAGVVSAELGAAAPPAALQALATAVRTQTLRWRGRHADEGCDLCDNTHCMLYQGEENGAAAVRRVLAPPRDVVLVRNGQLAMAPFTACCGGAPLPAAWIWPGAVDTGPGRTCDRCRENPNAVWTAIAASPDFLSRIGSALGGFAPARIRVEEPPGRSPVVVLAGDCGERRIPVEEFRIACGRTFGWNLIRSNRFQVRQAGDRLQFSGRGFGHNAGLCLAGAVAMACAGATVDAILDFYFPDCRAVSRASMASSQPGW